MNDGSFNFYAIRAVYCKHKSSGQRSPVLLPPTPVNATPRTVRNTLDDCDPDAALNNEIQTRFCYDELSMEEREREVKSILDAIERCRELALKVS